MTFKIYKIIMQTYALSSESKTLYLMIDWKFNKWVMELSLTDEQYEAVFKFNTQIN
jgi:hypothetical protein